MINQVMEKIKGFLLSPVETFRNSRGDEPVPVITYFIVLLVFNAILWGLMMAGKVMIHPALAVARLGQGADPLLVFITGLILVLVLQLFLILIWGLWLHIFSYIAGARKGIMETEKAVIYGSTPLLLIGWIPVIGSVIGGIWTIILTIIGLREMHEITTGKAILAYVLAIVVIFIVLILIVGWLVIAFMSGINPSNAMNY
jgi:hypothetical protein